MTRINTKKSAAISFFSCVPYSSYSWVGKESEIEFLKVMDNAVIPVEVKSGQRTRAKSLLVYENKYTPPLMIKITANNLQRESTRIHNYPLYLAGKIKNPLI